MRAVHQQFEQQAAATPSAVAVAIGEATLDYASLNRQANRIAHTLIARGIAPGDFVGICLDRSLAMVAGILGALKAGAVYVPMDTEYPAERLAYMLADSGVRLLLTDRAQARCLQLAEEQLLCLDDMAALDGAADTNPGLPVGDDQLIYMIYTSGSTGRPKGSLLYHRGFKNLVSWYVEEFGFDADTRVLHMTSPAFDLTQKNLFAPLVSGGRLCLLNSRVYDAGIIVDHIEQHRITALNCTPSAFGRLLSFGDEALYRRLQSLRYVFLGGEPIVVARLKAWLDNPLCQAQVINTYGPTECTDVVAYYRIEQPADFIDRNVPIGRALPGFRLEVLDAQLQPLPAAQPGQDGPREDRGGPEGQLAIAGIGVGAGYHGKPELTAASFVADPRSAEPGARIYLTGDRARVLADGNIDYLGRIDNQVKVRGFRIELGEIERVLEQQPAIREAAVTVFPDRVGDNRLAAYLVWDPEQARPSISDVRGALQQSLPDFMLPTAWVTLERLPLTPNGKLDRRALPEPQARRPVLDVDYVAPASPVEQYLVALWLEYLGLDRIGIDDRFFELGGSSLNAVDFIARLSRELDERIPIATFFGAPTIRSFSAVLWAEHRAAMLQKFPGEAPALAAAGATVAAGRAAVASDEPIAIIGLAGRFPGAADADALWQNLLDGVEAVQRASDEDLRAAGVAEEDIADPDYVRHFFSMDDVAYFDAAFFGYQPREVESMDPQHRLFLELAWTALDNAGYADTESYPGRIGVFGGIARDAYLHHYVARHPRYRDALGEFAVNMGNDKNFPCTRVAYKLNLRGPAVNVQTACSTSGVALHLACQSLRLGESDMALVGGCRVLVPTRGGYRYVEGSALSRDGRLHVFDRRGTGMVRGSGGAMLVIKRLADALRDGDCIRALVKATAINNDGSAKVGFTAPSVEGQSAVISEALQRAAVSPDSISYVEAHGTATALGDPIEVRGLTRAYRQWTEASQFAALGSIKSNIGHLDAGAAAAGIVKVVFAMENGELPASLNYAEPNPDIEFARTPLRVQARRAPWPSAPGQPLRAGVSSFGLGGTNFHGVLEQAPPLEDRPDSAPGAGRAWQLLTLSAKTEGALTANIAGLHRYRAQYPRRAVADLAYSLNRFRPGFSRRAFLLCASDAPPGPGAVALLRQGAVGEQPALVLAFPARRGPLRNAAPDLFRSERVFREAMQACGDGAATWLDRDLCASLYPLADADALADPLFADVAQFSLQYALARLWLSWGLRPQQLCGDGVGELAAAAIAGVFSLDDALALVARRARGEAAVQGLSLHSPDYPLRVASLGGELGPQVSPESYWRAHCTAQQPDPDTRDDLDWVALPSAHWALVLADMPPQAAEPGPVLYSLDGDGHHCGNAFAVWRALGELWLQGHAVDWSAVYDGVPVRRVPLPPYRFERQRYWADLPHTGSRLLTLSAASESQVAAAAAQWAAYLQAHPEADLHALASPAETTAPGAGPCRLSVVAANADGMAQRLSQPLHTLCNAREAQVVFMFPGGGAQYLHMGSGLYQRHAVFKHAVDEGIELHAARTGYDLRAAWFPRAGREDWAQAELARPSVQLPALFIVEVALARLWQHWGVQPAALLGHSLGENTAACIAGVMRYPDALGLVALRGQLFEQVEPGGMLSVGLAADALRPYLGDSLDLATINGPEQCTVSGPSAALAALRQRLERDDIDAQVIPIAIAAHSRWLDPILDAFGDYLRSIPLAAPQIPFISNLSGDWISDTQATDPGYWVQHLRSTVRFADGAQRLAADDGRVFLECGPGKILGSLVKLQGVELAGRVVPSLRHAQEEADDNAFLLGSMGRLWANGVALQRAAIERDWPGSWLALPLQPPGVGELPATATAPAVALTPATALTTSQPIAFTPAADSIAAPPLPEVPTVAARKDLIIARLKATLYDMSGIAPESLDLETTFLNMGFDSLFLTQANLRFKKLFNIKITLRQLLNEAPTLAALASFIDNALPADALRDELQVAAAPVASATDPVTAAAPLAATTAAPVSAAPGLLAGTAGSLQQAIALQIQANNAMLSLLQGGALAPQAAAAPPAPPVTAPATATPAAPTSSAQSAGSAQPAAGETSAAHGPFRPMQKNVSGELTDTQRRYLAEFMQAYQARTARSREYASQHRGHYADPRTVMGFKTLWKDLTYTLVGERSRGSHVWDIDGNEYVDCMSGFGAILFGHAPDFVVDAVREQLDKTLDYGPQSRLAGPAAALLCELTGMERASFCNTGSEAVLAAMRLARTVTGNDLIVVFSGDYHGIFDEVLVRVQDIGGQRQNRPIAPGIPQSASQNILVLDYGDPRSVDIIRERADEIAAVLIEPIQSRRPELTPKAFLHQVRAVTREADIPMIFDEIITGFRLHPRGAQAWYDVEVDIACYGKVIGGGFPVGVVAGKAKYLDALDGGSWQFGDESFPEVGVTYFAGTFIRHPLAIAAVYAVLKHLKAAGPALQQELNRRTAVFAEELNRQCREQGIPVELTYFGSVFMPHFHGNADFEGLFNHHLRHYGAHHIWGGRPGFLTTAHSDADIAALIRSFVEAGRAMQRGGFLPALEDLPRPHYPWTSTQSELWLAIKMGEAASAAYNEQVVFEFEQAIDPTVLELAVDKTLNRHPSLRAVVDANEEGLTVQPSARPEFAYRDLSALAEEEREAQVRMLAQANIDRAFDFFTGPLLRVLLLRTAPDRYTLCVSASHLVCDGWSLERVMEDIAAYYTGISQGRYQARPPVPSLEEFIAAEQALHDGGEMAEARAHWLKVYGDSLPPDLDLPLDRPRPRSRGYRGERRHYYLDPALSQPMRDHARAAGCTSFVLMLSVFELLIHRLSGQRDLVVGIPAAGQPNLGLTNLVAHGVSFLPLRVPVDPAMDFNAFMVDVRDRFMDAKDNQIFGYGELLKALRLPRDPSRLPLVTVSFNLDMAFNPLSFDGARARFVPGPRGCSKYDLLFTLTDEGERILVEVDRNSDILDGDTVDRWVAYYEHLLREVLSGPPRPLADLTVLDETSRQDIVEGWNATARDYPLDRSTLHGLVAAQVARSPDAIAVTDAHETLSYAELEARANRLAHWLRGQGIGPDQPVAVLMERCADMPVALYAILKAGGAYLPLDPEHPAERIRLILEESRAPLVICQQALVPRLPAGQAHLALDQAARELAAQPTDAPAPSAGPGHLAYVIYTSGSTGRPKGVMNEHRGICNRLLWMQEAIPLGTDDRVLQKTPYTFDVSVWEFFLPLMTGAQLVMAPPGLHRDSDALRALIRDQRISYLHFVPSMLQVFLSHPDAARCDSLRCVISSGEALSGALRDRLFAALPEVALYNLYGPTEAAVDVSVWQCRPGEQGDAVPIGRPIANTRLYVLDDALQPLPPGVPGELYIGGVQVARGYLNRPELTAERFVDDPFSAGERLYRTGDLARWRDDGVLEYLGRNDFQVKLRGLRIELGEIEAALLTHPGVAQCVVMAREDRADDQRLVAYIVPRGAAPDNAALREHLRTRLPDYMLPQHVVYLAAFPLTSSGKTDRRALPAPEPVSTVAASRAPAGEIETAIAAIWCEVLGLPDVGAEDDFFALGGHSLLGTRIFARLNRQYGIVLGLQALFEASTVAAQAQRVSELLQAARPATRAMPIEPRDPAIPAPASSQQMRLWYLGQIETDYNANNLPAAFRLTGPLDLDALQQAMDRIVQRQAALRTNIVMQDGELVQVVRENLRLDLSPVPAADFGVEAGHAQTVDVLALAIKRECAIPFDLATDPLIRAGLVQLAADDHVLYVIIHHVIFDGWSFDVLLHELFTLYNACRAGRPDPLPALPVSYADYATWQRRWLASAPVQAQLDYWLEHLAGELPILDLPLDRPRPPLQHHTAEAVLIDIDGPLLARLDAVATRCGATLFMVMLSLYAATLFRYTRQSDLLIGAPISGRNMDELSGLLGFFVNTLVFRLEVDSDQSCAQWLQAVKRECLQAYDHQDTPFELIIQHLKLPRDLSRSPVYQTLFIYQDVRNRTDQPDGMHKEQVNIELAGVQTDLDFWLKRETGHMSGGFEFPVALFERDTIAAMAASFMAMARRLADNPEQRIAELVAPTDDERARLSAWNATGSDYPRDRGLAAVLGERLQAAGDHPAVICGERSLSHGALERRANRLAHYLRGKGVGRGTLVALCQSRSEQLLVSLLAVWKAGGAYVPLDPDYPEERLRYMLETAATPVLLTESALAQTVADYACLRVCVDTEQDAIAACPDTAPPCEAGPGDPAYVIFTSGSTGKPKGVELPQRAVLNFLHGMARTPGFVAGERLLAITTLSFDIAVLELYLPLLMGGSLVLASAEEAMDGAALARLLDAQRIDLMQATPSTWRLLLASGWTGSGRLRALVGGEALPADLARDLQPRVKALWNMYGPTETAVWSTCYEVTDPQAPLLIGAPIANTRCHVVDTRGLPVPPGVAGELWIGGDGVATGYLARPELTAAQFVAEPGAPGQRCYRTGDRARWRREGLLEHFQRMDQQVKIRGFRIELGEIEAVLARHPAVEEVAVLARTYGVTDQRLVAYVRFAAGQHLTNTELRRFLRDSLPDYMIPQLLVEMEAMPLTPNGKLDRKALPDPLGDTRRERQMTPPRSDAERALAEIWREVLKVADIGIDSYFFDIGGHSLLAMEVMLRVKQRFGVALHPRELILNTLEQLAAQITGVQEAVDAGDGGKPERGPGLLRRLLGRRN